MLGIFYLTIDSKLSRVDKLTIKTGIIFSKGGWQDDPKNVSATLRGNHMIPFKLFLWKHKCSINREEAYFLTVVQGKHVSPRHTAIQPHQSRVMQGLKMRWRYTHPLLGASCLPIKSRGEIQDPWGVPRGTCFSCSDSWRNQAPPLAPPLPAPFDCNIIF